jgi:hypothetical protein
MEVCEINKVPYLTQSVGAMDKIKFEIWKDYYWTNGETAYTNDEPFARETAKYGQRDLFGLIQP